MFSSTIHNAVILGLAFLASGTMGAPVSKEAALERRVVANPCFTTIARTGADIATAATKCFDELSNHVFVGGKSGVLGSGSGGHLASGVLASAPEKAGPINAATLIMNAVVTPGTKTLWLDDGLKSLITGAETAEAARVAAEAKVATAEAALAKNVAKNKVKALQNAVTNAKAAVKALTPVQTLMLNTIKPALPNTDELYTKAGIKTMCVEAMKNSIAANSNKLKGGDFSVTAPNLKKAVTVRVQESQDKTRITSCFPVQGVNDQD